VVNEPTGDLTARAWHYRCNLRGIVAMENRIEATTRGYDTLCRGPNLLLVGDATLATSPASTTPCFATQVALHNAALWQLVTQAGRIR
jgi:hypothetical protein